MLYSEEDSISDLTIIVFGLSDYPILLKNHYPDGKAEQFHKGTSRVSS